jgi:hypothetical protein
MNLGEPAARVDADALHRVHECLDSVRAVVDRPAYFLLTSALDA